MGHSLWESERLKEYSTKNENSFIVYSPSDFPNLFDCLFCGKQKVNPDHSIEYNESEWSLSSSQMTKQHHKSEAYEGFVWGTDSYLSHYP